MTDPNSEEYHATSIAPLLASVLPMMCESLETAFEQGLSKPSSAGAKRKVRRKADPGAKRKSDAGHPVAMVQNADRARSTSPKQPAVRDRAVSAVDWYPSPIIAVGPGVAFLYHDPILRSLVAGVAGAAPHEAGIFGV